MSDEQAALAHTLIASVLDMTADGGQCWCSERRNDDGTFKPHEHGCPRHVRSTALQLRRLLQAKRPTTGGS